MACLLDTAVGRPAVVCGGGLHVMEELGTSLQLLKDPIIFAANDVGMFLPQLHHWVSLHSDNLPAWKSVRWLNAKPTDPAIHGDMKKPWIDHAWEFLTPLFAVSGYYAMQIAWLMGCSPIVLCGIPGERQRRFFDVDFTLQRTDYGDGADSNGVREQLTKEMERIPSFKATVRSMGGWTRGYFGGLD